MFEDIEIESGFNPQAIEQPRQQQSYQSAPSQQGGYQPAQQSAAQQGGYQANPQQGGYNRSSYQGGGAQAGGYSAQRQGGYSGGAGRSGFTPKEDSVQDAYIPVAIFVEKDYPDDVKTSMYNLASKLLAKNYTIRINADDKLFIDSIRTLNESKVEVYLPWRNFNEIESKRTFNTLTCKDVASKNFLGWDKIPDSVKAILASQVRILFGDRNNSIALCLVTWTKDAASKGSEVTKDTGRAGFLIKTANNYGFPVLNLAKPQSMAVLEKTFSL